MYQMLSSTFYYNRTFAWCSVAEGANNVDQHLPCRATSSININDPCRATSAPTFSEPCSLYLPSSKGLGGILKEQQDVGQARHLRPSIDATVGRNHQRVPCDLARSERHLPQLGHAPQVIDWRYQHMQACASARDLHTHGRRRAKLQLTMSSGSERPPSLSSLLITENLAWAQACAALSFIAPALC